MTHFLLGRVSLRRFTQCVLLLCGLCAPFRASAQQIAFTFDDLPVHGPLVAGETRLDVITKIIAALKSADLPPVYGFVNGTRIEEQPDTIHVLDAWRAAGFSLGSHTWSHMNLDQHTLDEFASDVLHNEPVLTKEMGKADWHWLRFPFLTEGVTPEKRSGVRAFLAQHGYRVAAVTMSFSDYAWNEPYARCAAKGDTNAIAQLEKNYIVAADQNIEFYRKISKTLYGRDIPYVLLLHVGAFDARMLPQLIDLYRLRGFTFVTLEQAEKDDFYRVDTNLTLPPGPDTLEGAMSARHLPLPSRGASSIQLNEICR